LNLKYLKFIKKKKKKKKGHVQSCIGLGKKNKVGVMSKEEEEAYKNIHKETKREILESTSQIEPLNTTVFENMESTYITDVTGELVKAKGGIAFDVHFHSTVPKLPPISNANFSGLEDYEMERYENSLSLSLCIWKTEYL
jgi:hypothetical protein